MTFRRGREHDDPETPPIADDGYWRSLTCWHEPRLEAAALGKLLGLSESTVRQYLIRDVEGFPKPLQHGWRNKWSKAQAYDYIDRHRPKRRAVIPRLYHSGYGLRPARFVSSESITLLDCQGAPTDWVVHTWLPSDNRGPVAVAYVAVSDHDTRPAEQLICALPMVSAVAVLTDDTRQTDPDAIPQASLVVADRRRDRRGDTVSCYRLGWFDLANILRVDIPWWPPDLRDINAMLAWRPGAPAQAVRPQTPWYNEHILGRLVTDDDDANALMCRRIIDELNRRIEATIYRADGPDVPGGQQRPGLTQAAYPRYVITENPPAPNTWDISLLLNRHIPSRDARLAARRCLRHRPELRPLIAYTIRTCPDRGQLAAEWVRRLEQIDADPESLGAIFAEQMLTPEQEGQPRTWWYDPQNPRGCWITETLDGTYHATVGTTVPATGRLQEFELESGLAAFFRDDAGMVWPIPPRGLDYFNSGYAGTGPQELVEAVTALRINAAADIDTAAHMTADAALSELIMTHTPPLNVSQHQINALLP